MSIPDQPFDPYDLHPLASLNRRQFISLPGIDPAWVGRTGSDLCSTFALLRLIQAQAAELGLEGTQPADLPLRLNDLLASPDSGIQAAARAIAQMHGRRLGGLIASILLSPGGLTSPMAAWEAAYLRHWREEVRQIVLGGGLANGRLGEIIAGEAEAVLRDCGLPHLSVRPARDPSFMPLVGAARRLPPGEGRVSAVADFGSTWAKRGLAYYRPGGELERLLLLPPVSTAGLVEPGKASQLAAEMVAILAGTIRQAGPDARLAEGAVCSLAAYVIDGQPAPQTGTHPAGYYGLHAVSNDLCGWFSARLSQACGRPLRLHFAHDAEAAAAALAGQEKAAVVMLGSALGIGFVPLVGRLRPMVENFALFFKNSPGPLCS